MNNTVWPGNQGKRESARTPARVIVVKRGRGGKRTKRKKEEGSP